MLFNTLMFAPSDSDSSLTGIGELVPLYQEVLAASVPQHDPRPESLAPVLSLTVLSETSSQLAEVPLDSKTEIMSSEAFEAIALSTIWFPDPVTLSNWTGFRPEFEILLSTTAIPSEK